MLLVTYEKAGQCRLGVLDRETQTVIPLEQTGRNVPNDMIALIRAGEEAMTVCRKALQAGSMNRLSLNEICLRAPIGRPPRNIICIGKNYRAHAHEIKTLPTGTADVPDQPIVFTKATTTVIGPKEPIPSYLDPTGTTDYEGELGVVIGRGGRQITRAKAMSHVFGYTILNDVTSRALQKRHGQWFLGKSLDGFCPMGPAILTADEVAKVGNLCVQTHVNGELRQQGCVSELIFDIPTLIETLSSVMTLQAGDIIATGTPAGVGAGFTPPRYLKAGDVVSVSIAPIGVLDNPVE